MSAADLLALRKGWCPGALRPMESGDGLVVRVRTHGGRLSPATALKLAEAALAHGNGLIDFTQRASVQLRGVSPATHPLVLEAIAELGLLDTEAAAEAVRNIIVDPLAGLQADRPDARVLAGELEQGLRLEADLHRLPGKFGFAIDPAATPVLTDVSCDIRIEGHVLGLLVVPDGATHGILCEPHRVVAKALDLARRFTNHPAFLGGSARRMRALVDLAGEAAVLDALGGPVLARAAPLTPPRPGLIETKNGTAAIVGIPFGRIAAGTLADLARRAEAAGCAEWRVSPWRSLVMPGLDARFLADIGDLGLVTRPDDPLMRIDACPGAPQCLSAHASTHDVAHALAGAMQRVGDERTTVHVTGCIKGCARINPADVVCVARDGAYDIVLGGRPTDAAALSGVAVSDLPAAVARLKRWTA